MTTKNWQEEFDNNFPELFGHSDYDGSPYIVTQEVADFIQQQINKAEENMKEKIIWMAEVTPDGQVVVPIDKIYFISKLPTNE